jgi:hypothetical protein
MLIATRLLYFCYSTNTKLSPSKQEVLSQLPSIPVHIEHDTPKTIGVVTSTKSSIYDPWGVEVLFNIYDDFPTPNFTHYGEIGLGLSIKFSRLSLDCGIQDQNIEISELSIMEKIPILATIY